MCWWFALNRHERICSQYRRPPRHHVFLFLQFVSSTAHCPCAPHSFSQDPQSIDPEPECLGVVELQMPPQRANPLMGATPLWFLLHAKRWPKLFRRHCLAPVERSSTAQCMSAGRLNLCFPVDRHEVAPLTHVPCLHPALSPY